MAKIYLSYAPEDRDTAETYRKLLTSQGHDVIWSDRRGKLPAGWPDFVGAHIDQNDVFVLLWSNNANCSASVEIEWKKALTLKKTIVPILLENWPALPEEIKDLGIFYLDNEAILERIQKSYSSDPESFGWQEITKTGYLISLILMLAIGLMFNPRVNVKDKYGDSATGELIVVPVANFSKGGFYGFGDRVVREVDLRGKYIIPQVGPIRIREALSRMDKDFDEAKIQIADKIGMESGIFVYGNFSIHDSTLLCNVDLHKLKRNDSLVHSTSFILKDPDNFSFRMQSRAEYVADFVIGLVYYSTGQDEFAEIIFRELVQKVHRVKDLFLLSEVNLLLGNIEFRKGQYKKATSRYYSSLLQNQSNYYARRNAVVSSYLAKDFTICKDLIFQLSDNHLFQKDSVINVIRNHVRPVNNKDGKISLPNEEETCMLRGVKMDLRKILLVKKKSKDDPKEYHYFGAKNQFGDIVIPPVYSEFGILNRHPIKARKYDKWGYIDCFGREVIPFEFDDVEDFNFKIATVRKGWMVAEVDASGNLINGYNPDPSLEFHCGLAKVSLRKFTDSQSAKCVFVDKNGREIISAIHDCSNLGIFVENRAWVRKGRNFGFIDRSGKMVIPAIYERVNDFREGRAVVADAHFEYLIDSLGQNKTPLELFNSFCHKDFLFFFNESKKRILVRDKSDKSFDFEDYLELIGPTSNCSYALKGGFGHWFIFDSIGKKIGQFPRGFEVLKVVEEKYFHCSVSGKMFLSSWEGKSIIPAVYSDFEFIGHEMVIAETHNGKGILSFSNEILVEFNYDDIRHFGTIGRTKFFYKIKGAKLEIFKIESGKFKNLPIRAYFNDSEVSIKGYFIELKRETKSLGDFSDLYSLDGVRLYPDLQIFGLREMITDTYKFHIYHQEKGEKRKKFGALDKNGDLIFRPLYNDLRLISHNTIGIKEKEKWGIFDRQGRPVSSFECDSIGTPKFGRVMVKNGGKYGFLDLSGDLIIKCLYFKASNFSDKGIAKVWQKKEEIPVMINMEGQESTYQK